MTLEHKWQCHFTSRLEKNDKTLFIKLLRVMKRFKSYRNLFSDFKTRLHELSSGKTLPRKKISPNWTFFFFFCDTWIRTLDHRNKKLESLSFQTCDQFSIASQNFFITLGKDDVVKIQKLFEKKIVFLLKAKLIDIVEKR